MKIARAPSIGSARVIEHAGDAARRAPPRGGMVVLMSRVVVVRCRAAAKCRLARYRAEHQIFRVVLVSVEMPRLLLIVRMAGHFVFAFSGGPNATAASAVTSRKVKVSCRYSRTVSSVWLK